MVVSKLLKYLLFTFNFIFFLGGICLLGVWAHIRLNQADYLITEELLPAVHLLMFVGAGNLVFGFLGCCGAITESCCLLTLFSKGLLSMFIMLLVVVGLGLWARTAVAQELVREHMKEMLPLSGQPKDVQESLQKFEKSGFCCGLFVGYLDWGNSSVVPDSCNCTDASRNCTVVDGREVYSTPCMTHLMTWLDRVSDAMVGAAVGFGALMFLGMILSSVLLLQMKHQRKVRRHLY